MNIKDILFSQHCYESPLWPFSESEPGSLPRYNPIIDSLFEPQGFSFHPDSAEHDKLIPNPGYPQFLQDVHEFSHSDLFFTKARGLMQLLASFVYELLFGAPQYIGKDSSLNVPSLDNWEALSNLRLLLNDLYKKFHVVEEIFAFYPQIKDLTAVYTGETDGTLIQKVLYQDRIGFYPFDQTPSQIEDEFIKEKKEEFGSDFEGLYRRYKEVLDKIGPQFGQSIHLYVLNPSREPGYSGRRLVGAPLQSSIFLFSPKERLSTALSAIEDTMLVGIRTWRSGRFLKFMNRKIPEFIRNCGSYETEFLPLFNYCVHPSSPGFFTSSFQHSSPGFPTAMRNLIYLKKRWCAQEDYETWSRALIKGDLKTVAERFENIGPCSEVSSNKKPALIKNLFVKPELNYFPLMIWEAIRQQIFTGKGLQCPLGYYYEYPTCKDLTGLFGGYNYPHYFLDQDPKPRGDICVHRKLLKFIWEHTEVDSNESEWTKPECL